MTQEIASRQFGEELGLGSVVENQRQAALLVFSMATADREWILNRLDQECADRLRSLIGELENLGLPKSVVASSMSSIRSKQDSPLQTQEPPSLLGLTQIEILQLAGAKRMFELAQGLPIELIMLLIVAHEWTWTAEFIENFDLLTKRQLKETLVHKNSSKDSSPQALQAALLEELAEGVAQIIARERAEQLVARGQSVELITQGNNAIGNLWNTFLAPIKKYFARA